MLDQFNRNITYLRISVTDRCNLRCTYCMPEECIIQKDRTHILSFDEIIDVVKFASVARITKIRLTGGEPLVRKGLPELISRISGIEGIKEVTLTTNGILLSQMARSLKQAGLNRVNISLDTLNPEKYRQITRVGNLKDVLVGIDAAKAVGLEPVKINFVRIKGVNEEDEAKVKNYCLAKGLTVRMIHQMDLEAGEFYPVEGGKGGICSMCDRLRLTSDGYLKPCLFSDEGFNIRELGIENAFNLALQNKPLNGKKCVTHQFYNIGG